MFQEQIKETANEAEQNYNKPNPYDCLTQIR
jgi:hypothetical protein